jgi:hypothetical protein
MPPFNLTAARKEQPVSALATFRTAVLALLNDPSLTVFSNAQVDQALRWALNEYDRFKPVLKTYSLDTDGNGILELPDGFDGIRIFNLELFATDIDDVRELAFNWYKRDEAFFIQTTAETVAAGEVLTVHYGAPNTIDDLDGAAGTTIAPEDEHTVQVGAAGYALLIRTASAIEENILNPDTNLRFMQLSEQYLAFFRSALTPLPHAGAAILPAVPTDTF